MHSGPVTLGISPLVAGIPHRSVQHGLQEYLLVQFFCWICSVRSVSQLEQIIGTPNQSTQTKWNDDRDTELHTSIKSRVLQFLTSCTHHSDTEHFYFLLLFTRKVHVILIWSTVLYNTLISSDYSTAFICLV